MDLQNSQWSEKHAIELSQLLLRDSHHYGTFFYDLEFRIYRLERGSVFYYGVDCERSHRSANYNFLDARRQLSPPSRT